jgi:ferrochelatase
MRKIAVVLCNLGGPDAPEAVRPFLFNLFNDKAIIGAPGPIRFLIASLISTTRAKSAGANYGLMGGRSPIMPETQAQADKLQIQLDQAAPAGIAFKVFIAMRYWRPFAKDAAAAAQSWGADEAIVLPLYPQFSTTTTASSHEAWQKVWSKPSRTICCYPVADGLIAAHAERIMTAWRDGGAPAQPRVLFSAHGLPQQVIDRGDSYQWQVERTVAAVRDRLPGDWEHAICYQSRVGPLKWIGPPLEQELARAGADQRGVIVSPIAFVSEHIETLVELDIEYAEKAHEMALPYYLRAKAVGTSDPFIASLTAATLRALNDEQKIASDTGMRVCPGNYGKCPMRSKA